MQTLTDIVLFYLKKLVEYLQSYLVFFCNGLCARPCIFFPAFLKSAHTSLISHFWQINVHWMDMNQRRQERNMSGFFGDSLLACLYNGSFVCKITGLVINEIPT